MRRLLTVLVLLASASLSAQEKRVAATGGWVKLPAAGETQAMAFVTVENPGMYEVNITSAKTDAAGKVELWNEGQATTFINVPAYGSLEMSAAGAHLLVRDLKRSLKEGDMVALSLTTDGDVTLTVTAAVRKE